MSTSDTTRPGRWPRSRLAGLGLLLRHRRPVRGPSLVVTVMVLAAAALVAATPGMFARMAAQELAQTMSQAPPTSRYLIARTTGRILAYPSRDPSASGLSPRLDAQFGTWQDQLAAVREGLPPQVRGMVGRARWTLTTDPVPVGPTAGTPRSSATTVVARTDVAAASVARVIAGTWPRDTDPQAPLEITLSEASARAAGVTVGSRLGPFRVSGIFRAVDPNADYWALNPGMVQPNIFDDGNKPIRITVTGFTDPLRWADLAARDPAILVWYPLDLSGLSGDRAAPLLAQLRQVVASPHPLPTDVPEAPQAVRDSSIPTLTLAADAIPALTAALGRVAAAQSVLTVAAAGPLAAAIAVLMLGVRALDRRRRPLIGMLASRGAARSRLRLLLTADGLRVGLIPAVLAAAVMWWVFGANSSPAGLALAVAVGLLPAAALAGMRIDTTVRRERADTGIRARNRLRWVAEVAVLALAGVSLYLLVTAGLGSGSDLLVAAAPLLLAGAACVLVLRLYPLPLRLLARAFRRRSAAVGFLGSVRALRDPVVGVAPVLAVLAGVSVAVFSAVTLSTVTRGADQAALADLGAPVRVTGVAVTDAQYDAVLRMPGVAAAARTMLVGSMPVQIGDNPVRPTVDVYLADTAHLAGVQRTIVDAAPIPGGMVAKPVAGAVVSTGMAEPGTALLVGSVPARVEGTAGQLIGLGRSPDFVLLDSAVTGFGPFRSDAVLIAPTGRADPAALTARLTALLGPNAQVRLAAADADLLRTGAMARGMQTALVAALIAAAVAAVAALLLTMIAATAARARLLAILRLLGLSVRQRRALVLWEQTPAAAVALLVGAALGLGLAALVHVTVDLAPFTGGSAQPVLSVDAGLLAALLGGFVVLVALATGVGLMATRRVTVAAAIKVDEE